MKDPKRSWWIGDQGISILTREHLWYDFISYSDSLLWIAHTHFEQWMNNPVSRSNIRSHMPSKSDDQRYIANSQWELVCETEHSDVHQTSFCIGRSVLGKLFCEETEMFLCLHDLAALLSTVQKIVCIVINCDFSASILVENLRRVWDVYWLRSRRHRKKWLAGRRFGGMNFVEEIAEAAGRYTPACEETWWQGISQPTKKLAKWVEKPWSGVAESTILSPIKVLTDLPARRWYCW